MGSKPFMLLMSEHSNGVGRGPVRCTGIVESHPRTVDGEHAIPGFGRARGRAHLHHRRADCEREQEVQIADGDFRRVWRTLPQGHALRLGELPTVERRRRPLVVRTGQRLRARQRERTRVAVREDEDLIHAKGHRRQAEQRVGIDGRNNRRAGDGRRDAGKAVHANAPRRDRTGIGSRVDFVNLATDGDGLAIGDVGRETQHVDRTPTAQRVLDVLERSHGGLEVVSDRHDADVLVLPNARPVRRCFQFRVRGRITRD